MQRIILTLLALCFSIHTQCSTGFVLLREEGISKNLTNPVDTIFATLALYPTWYRGTPLYSEEKLQKELRLYDGLNTIWEMDGNGVKTREYVTELGLDDILYEIQNGTYKYYHTDGLGSVTGITNETQQLIKRNYYRAYGEIYRSWGNNKSKIGFTSRDFNKDTGLIDLRARQYDPVIGRFISPDPFTRGPDDPRVRDMYKSSWYSKIHGELTLYTSFMKPNEFNRYAYCNNNPVNYTDPLGLDALTNDDVLFQKHYVAGGGPRGSGSNSNGSPLGRGITVTNSVPKTLARVVPGTNVPKTLGKSGTPDVFVTAANDIKGLNAKGIAGKLGIPNAKSFTVIEFPSSAISNIASPINRTNPGFQGKGLTSGGAREFVIPNQNLPNNSIIKKIEDKK